MTTSLRDNIASSTVTRLSTEVTTFNDVVLVKKKFDFGKLAMAPPAAAVVIVGGDNSDRPMPVGEAYIHITVQIYFSVESFAAGEGLTGDGNVYSLLGAIHAAIAEGNDDSWRPTGAHEGYTYRRDVPVEDEDEDESGVILWLAEYRTAVGI